MIRLNFTIAIMIYNVERFLPQTIESIIQQKGEDIEILLIDDGSNDSCPSICDHYANKDKRIRVIHQKNAGVAVARNVAINNANGRWLIQVDGDDVLLPNSVDIMRKYINDDADWVQYDAIEFVNVISTDKWKPKGEEMIIRKGDAKAKEFHRKLIDHSSVKINFPVYNINPAWAKMWNMDFIRKYNLYYYPEVVKGEGTLFTFTASYIMKKVRIVPKPIYGYRINPYSIMRRFSADILENQDVQLNTYKLVIEKYGETNDTLTREALIKRSMYLIENAIVLGISHCDCQWSFKEQRKWIKQLLNLTWVNDAAEYAVRNGNPFKIYQLIKNNNQLGLLLFCSLLRWKNRKKKILK